MYLKNFSGLSTGFLGIFFSVLGPISVKNVLNVLEISSGLRMISPLTFIWLIAEYDGFFVLIMALIPSHVFLLSLWFSAK